MSVALTKKNEVAAPDVVTADKSKLSDLWKKED